MSTCIGILEYNLVLMLQNKSLQAKIRESGKIPESTLGMSTTSQAYSAFIESTGCLQCDGGIDLIDLSILL